MCLAYPVKVVEVNKDEIVVDAGGELRKAVAIDPVKIGDYVLIDQGVVTEIYNKKIEEFFKEQGC
tara:strand:- start:246 stop:440 length:195 start_codon:yes stop_codon:yes gene_type:complete